MNELLYVLLPTIIYHRPMRESALQPNLDSLTSLEELNGVSILELKFPNFFYLLLVQGGMAFSGENDKGGSSEAVPGNCVCHLS